jgi:hypothetical protein
MNIPMFAKLHYEPLSENGGCIVDSEGRFTTLHHNPVSEELTIVLTGKDERPTIMNREAANSLLAKRAGQAAKELAYCEQIDEQPNTRVSSCGFLPHPDNIRTKEKPEAYRYRGKDQEVLSPEYQLYLAKQLEGKQKASKPTHAEAQELTGYLPHEESPQ